MKKNFLKTLHCPFCRKILRPKNIFMQSQEFLINGVVYCKCASYPILSSVLFLRKDENSKKALNFLKDYPNVASKYSQIPFFLIRLPKFTFFLLPLFCRYNFFKNLSFVRFVKLLAIFGLINKDWREYLLKRFTRKDFRSATKATGMVKKGQTVLDAGCGAGHLLSLLTRRTSKQNLVGIDKSILNIYLASKYFGKGANLIYLNMENGLPFESNFFDLAIANDVLSYISNKKLLASEYNRILKNRGLLALTNLKNKIFTRSFKTPLPHAESFGSYIKLLPKFKARTLEGSEKSKSFSILFKKP